MYCNQCKKKLTENYIVIRRDEFDEIVGSFHENCYKKYMNKMNDTTKEIRFDNIPTFSVNEVYGSWRKAISKKDKMYNVWFPKRREIGRIDYPCHIHFKFYFKGKPLDATNCFGMAKVIEDLIIANDEFDKVKSIKMSSNKSDNNTNYVVIKIKEDL